MNEKSQDNGGTGSTKRKRSEDLGPHVIELSDDEDAAPAPSSVRGSPKRQRASDKGTTPYSEAAAETAVTHSLPTPDPTPQKKTLYEIPEIADRYIPKTSTAEGIEYKNPSVFSLKPACFRQWRAKDFAKLAEDVRAQYNPIPFAIETGHPVDEVKHMFSFVVIDPLYDCKEAKLRGEKGMQEIIELYAKSGTRSRRWGMGEKDGEEVEGVAGELCGVAVGSIQLILANGSKKALMVEELSDADKQYLDGTLRKEDKRMLWKDRAAKK